MCLFWKSEWCQRVYLECVWLRWYSVVDSSLNNPMLWKVLMWLCGQEQFRHCFICWCDYWMVYSNSSLTVTWSCYLCWLKTLWLARVPISILISGKLSVETQKPSVNYPSCVQYYFSQQNTAACQLDSLGEGKKKGKGELCALENKTCPCVYIQNNYISCKWCEHFKQ